MTSTSRNALAEALSWVLIGCVIAAAIFYQSEVRQTVAWAVGIELDQNGEIVASVGSPESDTASESENSGSTVELTASNNGHFFTTADVNGRSIEVMVDTGASIVALTYEDAERAGIFVRDSDFTHRVNTANGVARIAIVNLSVVEIGDVRVRNVRAAVSEPGKLNTTLLGMSFLSKLTRTEIRGGKLILEQ